jgi:hypothetical protein
MTRAVSRTQEPVEPIPDYLPVIRSGDLFTGTSTELRDAYFDTLAMAPADQVAPEAVFGTNGWVKMNLEAGADPNVTKRLFDAEWEAMDFQTRRDLVYGNALDRFHMAGVDEAAGAAEMIGAKKLASALTGGRRADMALGMAAADESVSAPLLANTLFGRDPNAQEEA